MRKITSDYVGVSINPITGKWKANRYYKGVSFYLGTYRSELDAAQAYVDMHYMLLGMFPL